MRRRRNKSKIWIILGGIPLIVVIVFGIKEVFANRSATIIAKNTQASSTVPSAPPTKSTTSAQMYTQGNIVVARGKNYALSSIGGLTSPGLFAVKGSIVQIIPNPTTRSQTPYYFLIHGNSTSALVGIVVPAGEKTNFNVNAFPIGANVLVAGTLFPAVNPVVDVFDYSELLEELHVAPGLRQLNLPSSTPYIGANFRDVEVMG